MKIVKEIIEQLEDKILIITEYDNGEIIITETNQP